MVAQPVTESMSTKWMTLSRDAFFPTVAVQAMVRILRDPSISVHHVMVVQALICLLNPWDGDALRLYRNRSRT
jgi:Domain of unknown function (DUF3385)